MLSDEIIVERLKGMIERNESFKTICERHTISRVTIYRIVTGKTLRLSLRTRIKLSKALKYKTKS